MSPLSAILARIRALSAAAERAAETGDRAPVERAASELFRPVSSNNEYSKMYVPIWAVPIEKAEDK